MIIRKTRANTDILATNVISPILGTLSMITLRLVLKRGDLPKKSHKN